MKTQAYAVKNPDGWLVPWTCRVDDHSPLTVFMNIYPRNSREALLAEGYSVVPVRLIEEPVEAEAGKGEG